MIDIRFHSVILLILSMVTGAMAYIYESCSAEVAVRVDPNSSQKAHLTIFRPVSGVITFSIRHTQSRRDYKEESGIFNFSDEWSKSGAAYFNDPGMPIRILLTKAGKSYEYEALPELDSGLFIQRQLVPYVNDGDPRRFSWPPTKGGVPIDAGFNEIEVAIAQIEESISEETVYVVANPSFTFKRSGDDYSFFWILWVWPYFGAVVFIYALGVIASLKRL